MFNPMPLLLVDFYKTTHKEQYPEGMVKLVSYFTPRMSRVQEKELTMFGLQSFIKTYLIDYFDEFFFSREQTEVVLEYKRILNNTLGEDSYSLQKVRDLHKLGYLPLEIKAIPEGTRVPIKVPMIEISNTHPDFAWLVNTIESLMSAELWHPMISANVGYKYRKIVNDFYADTVDDNVPRNRALGDFSFRGQECMQSAVKSSAAFCLSFLNTATVPTIPWLEYNYNCSCEWDNVAYGTISTEHSVMCSNYVLDKGDEKAMLLRLMDIYRGKKFSVVCDSFDYWNVIDNILPEMEEFIKDQYKEYGTTLYIRGDSGDPVEIVPETVWRLYENGFAGENNTKGCKTLHPSIKVIYGDSITPERLIKIYTELRSWNMACDNVVLGVGSFSMQCVEEDGVLKPFTRDTFGIAVKSTYGEMYDGAVIQILKDPKTDTGNFKKSQKGLCVVYRDEEDGVLKYVDQVHSTNIPENELKTVFKDGVLLKQFTLDEVRQNLHGGHF